MFSNFEKKDKNRSRKTHKIVNLYRDIKLLSTITAVESEELIARGRRDDMPPPPAGGSSTRGRSKSIRGRVRSPHLAKMQAANVFLA